MPVLNENVRLLSELLSADEAREAVRMAKAVDREEAKWRVKLEDFYRDLSKKISTHLESTLELPTDFSEFDEFFLLHALGIQGFTLEQVEKTKLAKKPPVGKLPDNLEDLRRLWDLYRTRKKLPPRVKAVVDGIKKAYIKKCQSVWREASDDLLAGKVSPKSVAEKVVEAAAKTTKARAKMIVDTETTYYYNKARTDLYDKSDDITHYLFMAIRDHRTTKWCRTRHGLVYAKDDARYYPREKPPAHFGCRSEILPLSPLNPRHKALIDDPYKLRRNHKCEPLPKGWGRS